MQTLSTIKSLLAERGLRPRHRFGQNFLHDQNQLRRLVDAAGLVPGTTVLEVGPGTGTLTEALLEHGADVIAVELDRDLADVVEQRFSRFQRTSPRNAADREGARSGRATEEWEVAASGLHPPVVMHDQPPVSGAGRARLTLIRGDCLDGKHALNPDVVKAIAGRPFKLVANLPYNAATPLIINLLIDHPNCKRMAVTIQKEVAERLLAKPSTKSYGPLSIIAQGFARVSLIGPVPPSCFWPVPEVWSAMAAIGRWSEAPAAHLGSEVRREFVAFVGGLFTKRRKQLGTIVGRQRDWSATEAEGITPSLRPEALNVHQVLHLWRFCRGN